MKHLAPPFLPPTRLEEVDDAGLMLRVAARHRESFLQLHRRFAGVIYSTAFKVLNNQPDAEEVTQDVFAQIWEKASLYEPRKGKPLTWATTMTRNRAIDRLRANQRRCRLGHDFETEQSVIPPTEEHSAYEEAEMHDDARMLQGAIAQLTPDQREAIELVYYCGLTQKEAADLLDQPLGTIKARVRRAIGKLREVMPSR